MDSGTFSASRTASTFIPPRVSNPNDTVRDGDMGGLDETASRSLENEEEWLVERSDSIQLWEMQFYRGFTTNPE